MEEKVLIESVNREEKGASMLEYALLAALIAVVAIAAVTFLGQEVSQTMGDVGTVLNARSTTN